MSASQEKEKAFLSSYNIEDYNRPSVAADIVVLSVRSEKGDCYRKNPEHKLSILLIKRGEHPFLGEWALPGGFLRPNETIEECAFREIREETGFAPSSLLPVGIFSDPVRDPRGRVVSSAYASVIGERQAEVVGGTDAAEAQWFNVSFKEKENDIYELVLARDKIKIKAYIKEIRERFGKTSFEIVENNGLAFDHAKIIATALALLKKEAENIEVVFDFLPEKFTLTTLQKVQEALIGTSFITANFRRIIINFVEETGEYTEGRGHRPAKLYTKKGN